MTRNEAIAAGKRRYLGKPCVRGHDGWRYLLRDDCCVCQRIRAINTEQTARRKRLGLRPPRPKMALPEPPHASDFIAPIPKARLMAAR